MLDDACSCGLRCGAVACMQAEASNVAQSMNSLARRIITMLRQHPVFEAQFYYNSKLKWRCLVKEKLTLSWRVDGRLGGLGFCVTPPVCSKTAFPCHLTTSSQAEGVVSALFLDTSRWGPDHILRGLGPPHQRMLCDGTLESFTGERRVPAHRACIPHVMACLSSGTPTSRI